MNLHNKTYTNPNFRGSAMNPTFYQTEKAIEAYMDDHLEASYEEAASIINNLFKEFMEEHA